MAIWIKNELKQFHTRLNLIEGAFYYKIEKKINNCRLKTRLSQDVFLSPHNYYLNLDLNFRNHSIKHTSYSQPNLNINTTVKIYFLYCSYFYLIQCKLYKNLFLLHRIVYNHFKISLAFGTNFI